MDFSGGGGGRIHVSILSPSIRPCHSKKTDATCLGLQNQLTKLQNPAQGYYIKTTKLHPCHASLFTKASTLALLAYPLQCFFLKFGNVINTISF